MDDDNKKQALTLQSLADRAEISELFAAYASSVDDKDFVAWQALFTDDGSYGNRPVPKRLMVEAGGRLLEPFVATHHMLGQHSITLQGNEAHGRCYFMARHIRASDPAGPSDDVAGWYLVKYRRTTQGWRIVTVRGKIPYVRGNFGTHQKAVLDDILGESA
jgi:ketosteroid isomerase-like protein